jgi:hypothetical protein
MKKLVFALCMFFGAVVVVNAQDTTSTSSPTDPTSTDQSMTQDQASTQEDQGRTKIKSQDLPDAVKTSLESQEYRGWLVNAAYKMDASATQQGDQQQDETSDAASDTTDVSSTTGTSSAYNKEVYIVELKNGAQTKTVRFDKDGKKLDDGMNEDQE